MVGVFKYLLILLGLSKRFWSMKDLLVVRKLMVSPQYSCLSRISATVAAHQLYVTVASLLHFLPILFQYSVSVSTFSERSCLAIGVGPKPETHISKICLTTFAAGSSTIHSALLLGFFIYTKDGFGSKRFVRHFLALHYPTHLIAAYCRFAPETQNLTPLYGFEAILGVFFRVINIHRPSRWFFSFGHSPAIKVAPYSANVVCGVHLFFISRKRIFYLQF